VSAGRATVRLGLVGAGFIAGYHLEGLRAAGGAEVRVLCSRTPAKAAELARRYGIGAVTDDWRRVVEDPAIDAVVIATPDFTHEQFAVAAARAGKHILLQKPMARTVAEGRRIVEAARAAGVFLQVSFMHRYFEEVVRARELLAQKALGPVYAIRMRNATPGPDWQAWFYRKESVGGGVVMQLGIHGIDLVRHLFGDIESVSAVTALQKRERRLADGSVVHPDNEDHALAIYRLAGGAIATHEMSMSELAGCDRFALEIYGEGGTLWLRTARGPLALYAPSHSGVEGWVVPPLPQGSAGARHHAAFLDIVRGRSAPDTTAADGLATLQVAHAIYEAAQTRREQPVAR
jgi:predicted dehydrogenase